MKAETKVKQQPFRLQRVLARDGERQRGLQWNRRVRYHAAKFVVHGFGRGNLGGEENNGRLRSQGRGWIYGAGDGNRTHVRSLGSFYTAIVRRPLGVMLRRIIHNCDWVRKEGGRNAGGGGGSARLAGLGADKFILRRVSRTALEWCK